MAIEESKKEYKTHKHKYTTYVNLNTKTKMGKDYYDFFYSTYNLYPTKFDFIINVSELPYRGLSSIIQVKVDQDLIHEFFTNPDEEFIKEQVATTFQRLINYASHRGKLKNEFTY